MIIFTLYVTYLAMMKKNFIVILGILLSSLGFSQNFSVELKWEDEKLFSNDYQKMKSPYFNEENFVIHPEGRLDFVKQWEVNQPINEASIQIVNPVFETISTSRLLDLNSDELLSSINPVLSNGLARDKRYAMLRLNPIIKESGVIKRLVSFDVSYQNASNFSQNTFSNQPITNSVLSSGDWYRFSIHRTGVFRIDAGFLSSLGINTSNINPQTIRIFGRGGKAMPFTNAENLFFDPEEIAIQVVGENDGSFDSGDYILFYAVGHEGWNEESDTNINSYIDNTFYYLNVNAQNGKRITQLNEPVGTPNETIDTFLDFQFHENDDQTPTKIGRRWFGEDFDVENVQTFPFEFPNIDTSRQGRIKVNAISTADSPTSMQINIDAAVIDILNFTSVGGPIVARADSTNSLFTPTSSTMNVVLDYNNNGNPASEA
ncbi:MAG: hypothetical protein HRT68_09720 [Flavobacteriaceae bacterium]|nr:hypothetical protein [Flavobacteriaceae bacterium]